MIEPQQIHRLERVLDRSSDKKNVVRVARASYITYENRRSDIVHLSHLFKLNRACANAQTRQNFRPPFSECGNRMGDASLG